MRHAHISLEEYICFASNRMWDTRKEAKKKIVVDRTHSELFSKCVFCLIFGIRYSLPHSCIDAESTINNKYVKKISLVYLRLHVKTFSSILFSLWWLLILPGDMFVLRSSTEDTIEQTEQYLTHLFFFLLLCWTWLPVKRADAERMNGQSHVLIFNHVTFIVSH